MDGEMDTAFVGGNVYVPGHRASQPQGLLVRDGRIALIADDTDIRDAAATSATVHDLRGGVVLPGFIDSHAHPLLAGVELGQCDLSSARDAQDTLATLARYAETADPDAWVTGGGWSMDHFGPAGPTRAMIDGIVGDRPAALVSRDHHTLWVSTAALARAGITSSTPNPTGGVITRDAYGSPSGTLHERAMDLVLACQPPPSQTVALAGLRRGQEAMAAAGVTSWLDARVGAQHGLTDTFETYLTAAVSEELRSRVSLALWWDPAKGAEQVDSLIDRRHRLYTSGVADRVRASAVKIMIDGVAENGTAALSGSYLDKCGDPTGNRGELFLDQSSLEEAIQHASAAGFDLHFHAIGDRAVSATLDALEKVRPRTRATFAHVQMVAEKDFRRLACLDATACLQMLWAQPEPQLVDLTLPYLPRQLRSRQYPFGQLRDAQVRLAGGSDWPVSSAHPLDGIRVGVDRTTKGQDIPLGGAQQRLALAEAVTAYTLGSAWVLDQDHLGSLAVGSPADLVVLSNDPLGERPAPLDETTVVSTIIDGTPVYQAQSVLS